MINRRDFIKGSSVLALGAMVGCTPKDKRTPEEIAAGIAASEAAKDKRIGLQIYSLGPELYAGDLSANLKRLKDMGFTTLELAGYNVADSTVGGVPMMDFKKAVEDCGLEIVSSHANPPELFAGVAGRENKGKDGRFSESLKASILESWKKMADDHAKMGIPYLVEPMMPVLSSKEEVLSFCDLLNASGEVVKASGVKFGYHNHNMEFAKVVPGGTKAQLGTIFDSSPGEKIFDLFLANTDPANVLFEMDVYWTVMGQNDPVEYLREHADRIKLLHIKDRVVLGQSGMMNFKNIFDQFYANGGTDFFVEVEDIDSGKQFERVEGSVKYLKESTFVK